MEKVTLTIDLLDLMKYLVRKWWILALSALVVAGATFCVSYYCIAPTYTADIMLYVNNTSNSKSSGSPNISTSELSAAQSLVDTYIVILQSRTTYESVREASGEEFAFSSYKNMIQAAAVNNTEIFSVKVTTTNPNRSANIANAIASTLPDTIAATVDGSSVRVVQKAQVPSAPAGPHFLRNTAIGFIIGFLLCAAVLIIRKIFDDSIRDEDYLTTAYPEIPLLAIVPDVSTGKRYGYYRSRYYKREYYKKDYGSAQKSQDGGAQS